MLLNSSFFLLALLKASLNQFKVTFIIMKFFPDDARRVSMDIC
jgi:hypothetical protein